MLRGLVEREHDPDDHRVVRLTLTPKGHQMVEDLQTAAAEYLTQVFEQMDENLIHSLIDCLEAFCGAARWVEAQESDSGSR